MVNPHALPEARCRLVLLGASNLRLGQMELLRQAQQRLPGPMDVFVAHGFGRSYGWRSSIPYRALPGIISCRLWEDAESRPSLPTFALVTDVGNDLLYGASPADLMEWVRLCVDRLHAMDARIVITELPIESILTTTKHRYRFFRKIFFPRSALDLAAVFDLAQRANEALSTLAREANCALIAAPGAWYGIDPIHVRRRFRRQAWQSVVDAWAPAASAGESAVLPWKNRIGLQFARPDERWLLGVHQRAKQPSATLGDGTTVRVY